MQPHRSPRDQIMFIFKLVSALALSMAQRQAQTWLLSWNQFLSLKEFPKSAEGHHPPSLPDRFSLWQKRLWTKSQSVNEHKHLPLREAKGRNCDSGEAGEQLNETVPLLSGDRGFLSALTPSPPGQHRMHSCPEFQLGVSPSCAKLYNQSHEEKLVMELLFATPRSEFSASSTYPMYLITQRKWKKKHHQNPKKTKTPKKPKPQTKKAVLHKRLSVTNVSLENRRSNAEKAIINCFI